MLPTIFSSSKTALVWLADHWYIPFTIVGAAISYIVFRRGPTPLQYAQSELDAVAAKREVTQIAINQGTEAAHAHVATKYAEQQSILDEEGRREAATLQEDPAELAAYLVRVGNRLAAQYGYRPGISSPPDKKPPDGQ